jgi:hypothetical protein
LWPIFPMEVPMIPAAPYLLPMSVNGNGPGLAPPPVKMPVREIAPKRKEVSKRKDVECGGRRAVILLRLVYDLVLHMNS